MTVNLLLILLLETKYYLSWYNTLVWELEVQVGIESERGSIFEQVCRYFFSVNTPLHVVSRLVYTQNGKTVEYTRMYFLPSIGDDTNDDLYE